MIPVGHTCVLERLTFVSTWISPACPMLSRTTMTGLKLPACHDSIMAETSS